MRDGATDVELAEIITSTWTTRDDRYSELRGGVAISDPKVEMSYIGG